MNAIKKLNEERHMSLSLIASKVKISKPQLRKYILGEIRGSERAKITFRLNKLVSKV
jgi:transcriptional regulator with XRE-family HTH domain